MFKNYIKIIFRNLRRYKTFSLINILGLAVGIAACLVIYKYVTYEKSYDKFNKNADRIYRLKNIRYYSSGTDSSAGCVARLGPTLKEELPEVVDFSRVRRKGAVVTANNHSFNEHNMFWADSSFLTIFSYPLIAGNAQKALSKKYTAVLTKNTARKYFGDHNAMGERISLSGMEFEITAILENVPPNSHIHFDILLSFSTQLNDRFCWGCNNNNTYIVVTPETKEKTLDAKLPMIVSKLHNTKEDGFERAYLLQSLKDIHLHSNLRFEHEENGNVDTVYFLSLIAIFILLIAWINYINLSTARSIERAKEVGLRKVIGAWSFTLIRQFLLESFIINFIAIALSFFFVEITRPYWTAILGMPTSFSLWTISDIGLLFFILVFISPLVAGLYPALILSSYSPLSILRGSFKSSMRGILLRKSLVIFQFAITIMLIIAIVVFERQLSFMLNKNLGIEIDQKLVVNAPFRFDENTSPASAAKTFIDDLRMQKLIKEATFSSVIPGMEIGAVSGGVRQEGQTHEQGKQVYFVNIAQNYVDFFGIDLLSGRNFFDSEIKALYQEESDSRALIINAHASKAFGFSSPEKAIGAAIIHDNNKIGRVVGVIKDYHQQSMDKEIKPVVFEGSNYGYYFVFDINTEHLSEKIKTIKNNFMKHFPGNPFEFRFLDEFFDRQYTNDIKTAEILGIFTFLSVFISCLGLIGLSSLMTLQKTKEIGIRKVLGASVTGVLHLLSKDFMKLVATANIIAWPLIWYIMKQWLQNFAYRIQMNWWTFVLAGCIALLIALLTLSWQAIRAATANPVESLRYE